MAYDKTSTATLDAPRITPPLARRARSLTAAVEPPADVRRATHEPAAPQDVLHLDGRRAPVPDAPAAPAPAESGCVFCAIVAGKAPATVVRRWRDAIAIVPLGPIVAGHVLVIPTTHVPDAGTNPTVSGAVMSAAAELAAEHEHCNIITSRGRHATQTVRHLHLHVVPRAADDGLLLPWSAQTRTADAPPADAGPTHASPDQTGIGATPTPGPQRSTRAAFGIPPPVRPTTPPA